MSKSPRENREGYEDDGSARRRRAQGPKTESLQQALSGLDKELPGLIDEFAFGAIWGRPGLTEQERMSIAIAALAATEQHNQLVNYLWGALHAGVPASKIHEILMMMCVYAGFPKAISALSVWKEIRMAARRQGLEIDIDIDE